MVNTKCSEVGGGAAGKVWMFETIDDLTGLWASEADFARDIGVKPSHLAVFKVRRNIPSTYWPGIIEAAQRRATDGDVNAEQRRRLKGVTAEALLKLQVKMAQSA